VTNEIVLDRIVDEYLSHLEVALADLPSDRRQQLMESITDHIREARVTLSATSEVAVRDILDRVGQPADIAAEALADQAVSPPSRASRSRRVIVAGVAIGIVLLLVFGSILVSIPNKGVSNTTINVTTTYATVELILVPNVTGLSLNSAESDLQKLQLTFQLSIACTSSGVQPGFVASQSPNSGSSITEGSPVRLITPKKNCS
jgi:uncharacterized membrane protein